MSTSNDMGFVAFDIGSKKHAWASDINGRFESDSVNNDPTALRAFLKTCLKKTTHLRVLAEATGVYYLDVMLIAHELGAEVMVINPAPPTTSSWRSASATRPTSSTPRCC